MRPEVTFARLRYSLGGDRPSQTARLAGSPQPIQTRGLELHHVKGGIPKVAPYGPKLVFPSLPPILCMTGQNPVPGYSKAPWGLSVQPRVPGVFTGTTISPGLSLRQRSDRYTIRAGRNLPDKEFRYLRTVIVTAAVYRGFISKLRTEALTSPFNLPAPGRCQSLYVGLRLMQRPVFLVNSRLSLVSATPLRYSSIAFTEGAPLLPRLRGQLAEFLNESYPAHLSLLSQPTCVGLQYGRAMTSLAAFPGSIASATSPSSRWLPMGPRLSRTDLPVRHACTFGPGLPSPGFA